MDDDPWGNAWRSTTEITNTATTAKESSRSPDATPTWPVSSVAAPSFSDAWGSSPAWEATDAVDEPTGGGWGSSLEYHEDIPAPDNPLPEPELETETEPEEQVIEYLHRPSSPSYGQHKNIPHSPLPSSPPPDGSQTGDSRSSIRSSVDEPPITPRVAQVVLPPVTSPGALDDGFGGFESGDNVGLGIVGAGDDPWSPGPEDATFTSVHDAPPAEVDPAVSSDAWGATWAASREKEEATPAADEWEIARARKERLDRKIPPEVVSGYLSTWESAVTEIWPDAPLPRSEPTTEWRAPLEDIDELQKLRKIYHLPTMTTTLSSPPPALSPLPPYASTQIFSRQRAALKATRISAVAQLSPFAHLTSARSIQATHRLSSKASISTTRSSLDFGSDVVGVGWAWAHDEKKKPEHKPVTVPATAPVPATVSVPAVVAPVSTPSPTTTGRFSGFWARARGSTDRASTSQGSRSNTPVPLTSPSTSSLGDTVKPAAIEPAPPVDPSPPALPAQPAPPVEQPVSGVSRFFKRFSRTNPLETERVRLATSESVSLSASDLEFLEDFVPDSNPKSLLDGGRGLTEFDALESMLKSKPLPKDVPVLAPPPRVGTSSGVPSPLAAVPENPNGGDDLWDVFGASSVPVPTNGLPSTPHIAPSAPVAPSTLTPSLTPKVTTPVGSAPASRSHTPRLPSIADLAAVVGNKGSHLRQTSFSTRAQQAFRADVPSLDSPSIPALPPPPAFSSGSGPPKASEPDIFADFLAGPSAPMVQNETGGEAPARLSFDDFGDFESSAPAPAPVLRSPSPPKPPSKTGTPVFIRTGSSIQRVSDPQASAAPPLLPPPPSIPLRSSTPSIAPPPLAAPPSFAPPPSLPPPPSLAPPLQSVAQNQPQIDLFDFGSSPPRDVRVPAPPFTSTTLAPASKLAGASASGGLSASDLSFFEGL
ncbi:major facilitator superfamily transporter [Ceratobasidium sp. AG-Ba]|nr:major facilitator superfamily transporter [Ceratobasidium sp. AG-Ba]QRW03107.1 major facilitator superfamily transporter [Ceratobasidium sp. AG-Ba]